MGLSVLGSFGGLLTASTFLLLGDHLRIKLVPWLISYAVGTLLGVALLALLPEALDRHASDARARNAARRRPGVLPPGKARDLAALPRLRRSAKSTRAAPPRSSSSATRSTRSSTARVIAAAVITSIPLGITTALAVAAHEIPQEVGDVAILLRAGFSKLPRVHAEPAVGHRRRPRRSGDADCLAVDSRTLLPYVLSFAAGNFLYVAMADLIPDLHRGGIGGGPFRQLLLIVAGVATISLL